MHLTLTEPMACNVSAGVSGVFLVVAETEGGEAGDFEGDPQVESE